MDFKDKYLKYKMKYLSLKKDNIGGYIKVGDDYIKLEDYDRTCIPEEIELYQESKINKLDRYMPLVTFQQKRPNTILINNNNYILYNNKTSPDFQLYQLDDNFIIKEIPNTSPIFYNSILIPGINKNIFDVNLIQSYQYYNKKIFTKFLKEVPRTAYPYFNRLSDIMYKRIGDLVTYNININIVLSILFMNITTQLLAWIKNINLLLNMKINYHQFIDNKNNTVFKKSEKVAGKSLSIDSGILIDYLLIFVKTVPLNELENINTFEELNDYMNKIFSNTKNLDYKDDENICKEYNTFMIIVRLIYQFINKKKILIDMYNYTLYTNTYRIFEKIVRDFSSSYKAMQNQINLWTKNVVTIDLVLNISCLIYLCYKTNLELDERFKSSQYMLLDYFWGITNTGSLYIPINRRQILINLIGKVRDTAELQNANTSGDPIESAFFNSQKTFSQKNQVKLLTPVHYSDCGETTLLNLFNYLLLKEDGTFNLENLAGSDQLLLEFYERYPTMERMNERSLQQLKEEWDSIFINRGTSIRYNRDEQCDINTTLYSIIKTCNFILNLGIDIPISEYDLDKKTAVISIFRKLNRSVKDTDIEITRNYYSFGGRPSEVVKYINNFELELNDGHGTFSLIVQEINMPSIVHKLDNHWINFFSLPSEYSLEHFKYIFNTRANILEKRDFFNSLTKLQQTEAICKYVIEKVISLFDYIKNKTEELCEFAYNIAKVGLIDRSIQLINIPDILINQEIYDIAVINNYREILNVPPENRNEKLYESISKELIQNYHIYNTDKSILELLPYDIFFNTLKGQVNNLTSDFEINSKSTSNFRYKKYYNHNIIYNSDYSNSSNYTHFLDYFVSNLSKLNDSDAKQINIMLFKSFPYYIDRIEDKTDEIYEILKYHLLQDSEYFDKKISEYPIAKIDEKFLIDKVRINPEYISRINDTDITYHISLEVVCNNIKLLNFIPPRFRTTELYKIIIDKIMTTDSYNYSLETINLIPQTEFTESNFINIIKKLPEYFERIESRYKTPALIEENARLNASRLLVEEDLYA